MDRVVEQEAHREVDWLRVNPKIRKVMSYRSFRVQPVVSVESIEVEFGDVSHVGQVFSVE